MTPADSATVFRAAGLLPLGHTQRDGKPWPTLRQMIDSDRRVVVLMERRDGGTLYPWLLQGFDWVQDTPFENPTMADLSCRRERGSPDSSILMINHWLGGFRSLVTDARRGQLPTFVAVKLRAG